MAWIPEWLAFAGVMALGQFSPGPDMVLLTRTALAAGRKAGCWTALGIATGLALHAALAVAGVALVLARDGWISNTMKWIAAAYLAWLAFQLIRSGLKRNGLKLGSDPAMGGSSYACWKRGLLCNLLNPKVAVFLAAVTAPFLAPGRAPGHWPLVLWLTIVIEGLVLWCAWVSLLQAPPVRRSYMRAAHWPDLAFGMALLVLAVLLVVKQGGAAG